MELLKSLARSLGQMGLYKPGHPAVQESLAQVYVMLNKLLSTAPEISIALDNDKVLANGRLLFSADRLPGSLRNIFTRLRLHSITFLPGVTQGELTSFCELAALKSEPGHAVKAGDFLKEKGVEKIRTNEDIYAKVEKKPKGAPRHAAPPSQEVRALKKPAVSVGEQIAGQSFESAVGILAEKASPDNEDRKKIVQTVLEQFRRELDQKIRTATEQLRKEKKKIENDQMRTESVISSAAEGLVVVDNSGKILMMNPAAEQISGKPLSESVGKAVFDIAGLEKQVVALAKEISSPDDRNVSKEITLKGDPDTSRSMRQSTAVVQSQDGKIVGTMSVPPDIAKYKETQKMQRDFVANVTHELRSPLTSIRAALEMLNRDLKVKLGATDMRVLNTAIRNSERLGSLINDILDFSKLESGALTAHPQESSAAEIASEAVESMQSWASTKSIRLSLKTAEGLPAVFADKNRSVQILINLISNSLKFTPNAGSIDVLVARGQPGLSHFVVFSVKDTGCGMSKKDQPRIFEKFVQAVAGERTSGTGLGLAITKALVVMQGGKIQVESEPGKGSTFSVFLPVYSWQGKETPAATAPPPAEPKSWWRRLLGR